MRAACCDGCYCVLRFACYIELWKCAHFCTHTLEKLDVGINVTCAMPELLRNMPRAACSCTVLDGALIYIFLLHLQHATIETIGAERK